jgi:hypothetical protein
VQYAENGVHAADSAFGKEKRLCQWSILVHRGGGEMKTRYQIFVIALLFVVVMIISLMIMSKPAPTRTTLATAPISGGIALPTATNTSIPPEAASNYTYVVNDTPVKTLLNVDVYEKPDLTSRKIGNLEKDYQWILQRVKSTPDGNYWGLCGNGWILLYNAKINDHESTDWSLDKWIQNGKQ